MLTLSILNASEQKQYLLRETALWKLLNQSNLCIFKNVFTSEWKLDNMIYSERGFAFIFKGGDFFKINKTGFDWERPEILARDMKKNETKFLKQTWEQP